MPQEVVSSVKEVMRKRPIPSSEWIFHLGMLVLLFISFFGVFRLYVETYWWLPTFDGLYSLAPLVLIVSCWLIWRRRRLFTLHEGPYLNRWVAYSFLILGALIKIHGELEGYPLLRGLGLIPILLGYFAVLFPVKTLRGLLFPVLYLLFAIPLPPFLIDEVTQPLLNFNTGVIDMFLRLLQFDFMRTGNVFLLNDLSGSGVHQVEMVEGCSGIRSLFSLLALSALYLYFRPLSTRQRVGLLLTCIPLAGLGNTFRVIVTFLLILYVSPAAGQRFFHEFSGVIVFLVTLVGLFTVETLVLGRTDAR